MRNAHIKVLPAVLAVLLSLTAACDKLRIYDAPGECDVPVGFRFDYNMGGQDLFPEEVKSVTVYVFDQAGNFVAKASGTGPFSEDYVLQFPDLPPGNYDLVAWCGLEDNIYNVPDPATKDALMCLMDPPAPGDKTGRQMNPLWYGYMEDVELQPYPVDSKGEVVMNLVKNTKNITVLVQTLNPNSPISVDEYEFVIYDNNLNLDWQNNPSGEISYYPWDVKDVQIDYAGEGNNYLTAAVADFSTSRLIKRSENKTTLAIIDKVTGKTIISVPLVDYLLAVKGNFNSNMSDQEYLDRQNQYSVTFFIDNTRNWYISAGIYVNGWHVILQNSNLD